MSQTSTVVRAAKLFGRFKARELVQKKPVSLPEGTTNEQLPQLRNPFIYGARRSPTSKGLPSPYSLRRQKELFKAARLLVATGKDLTALDFLPLGPKTQLRVTGGGVDKALASIKKKEDTISVAGVTNVLKPSTSDAPKEVAWVGEPKPRKTIGMYEGRKIAFKRHKSERERQEKADVIQAQLKGMEKRIEDWRNVCTELHYDFISDSLAAKSRQDCRIQTSILMFAYTLTFTVGSLDQWYNLCVESAPWHCEAASRGQWPVLPTDFPVGRAPYCL